MGGDVRLGVVVEILLLDGAKVSLPLSVLLLLFVLVLLLSLLL